LGKEGKIAFQLIVVVPDVIGVGARHVLLEGRAAIPTTVPADDNALDDCRMTEREETGFNEALLDDGKSCDDPLDEIADSGKLEFEDDGIGLIEDPAIEDVGLLTPPSLLPSPPQAAKIKQTVITIIFFTQVCMARTSALNTVWVRIIGLLCANWTTKTSLKLTEIKTPAPGLAFSMDYFVFIAALRLVWRQPHKPGVHSN
jgi:hypothetical protein